MDPRRREQILHWICTGKLIFLVDHDPPKPAQAPTALDGDGDDDAAESAAGDSSSSSTLSSVPDILVGADDDDDLLIPSWGDIERVFHDGRATWARLVKRAEGLAPRAFPEGFAGDLAVMLRDVPGLPVRLPRKGALVGQAVWRVPGFEEEAENGDGAGGEEMGLECAHGRRRYFHLSSSKPVECRIYGGVPLSGHGLLASQRGLAVLTMCWSYILSARLLELQGRKPVYIQQHALVPIASKDYHQIVPGQVVLKLGSSASPALVRWLCALLAPLPGWSGEGGDFPPWAAFCAGELRFCVVTPGGPGSFSPDEPAPGSAQATELLIALCEWYGLLAREADTKEEETLSPATAAFLAALALPFSRSDGLQPLFPAPCLQAPSTTELKRRGASGVYRAAARREAARVRQYVADLRYYMPLSMEYWSLGSALWSIFYQPEVAANLVGAWLGAIRVVLAPILEKRGLAQMAKVFALRRPRVALWWLGVLLLGDFAVLDRIARYLETLEERWGYGSAARPDPAVAAWTGAKQSYLDDVVVKKYEGGEPKGQKVKREDVLRQRYNFYLQSENYFPEAWRPFGDVARELVEPELWPGLERGFVRECAGWVWWVRVGRKEGKNVYRREVQLGFRRDTGRFVEDVPDELGMVKARGRRPRRGEIKLEPSKLSTYRMLVHCMEDASGGFDGGILAMPGVREHPWLRDWRGLEMFDG